MSNLPKTFFTCACGKKTSTTNPERAAAKVCIHCRPDLDTAPAKAKTSKAKAAPAPRTKTKAVVPAPAPAIERVPGTLADARRAIGPNADFEGFRAEGHTVMYLYEEPAEAPARAFSMAMAKRRLNEPQFQLKFASLLRKGQMAGMRVTEISLDPAAPENVTAAEVATAEPMPESTDTTAAEPVAVAAPAADPAAPATVVPSKRKKPSALDAAALVLRETGEAMTVKEIFGAILGRKLWASPNGKTPAATLQAAMGREIQAKGKDSRFAKANRGKFSFNPVVARKSTEA